MSQNPPVTIIVVTSNETGGTIADVKVSVGGEVIDYLAALGKGASTPPNQYNGPSGDLLWNVSFTDQDGDKKAGSVGSAVTSADNKASVVLNADSFTVNKPSGDATGTYS